MSKLDPDTNNTFNAQSISEKVEELTKNIVIFKLLAPSIDSVQTILKENILLKTLIISSREVKKFDDKSFIKLTLYSSQDQKDTSEKIIRKTFEQYLLSTEAIEDLKENVDKSLSKLYFFI